MSKHDFYVVDGCVDFVPVKRSTLTPNGVEVTIVGSVQKERVLVDRVYQMAKIFEPKKVKIPKFVAVWIEECRSIPLSLNLALNNHRMPDDVAGWLIKFKNQETFARAWLDGYEVEQEPKYRVMMVNPNSQGSQKIMLRRLDGRDSSIVWAKCKIANNRLQCHTKSELEQAGFGWVFDCEGVKVEEVK